MFLDPDDPEFRTTQERFHDRIDYFKAMEMPTWRHHFWWVMHNAVAHPLIAFLPSEAAFDFHDYTSDKINAKR